MASSVEKFNKKNTLAEVEVDEDSSEMGVSAEAEVNEGSSETGVSAEVEVNEDGRETGISAEDEDSSDLDEAFDSVLSLSGMVDFSTTAHMRCAVHTLQLAIWDGLKEKDVDRFVSKVRHIAITARTPKIDAILKRKLKKGAIIDQATRWGSTYLMIQRLLELKDCLLDLAHPNLTLTENQWNEVKQLEELLRHPFLATKRMQSAHLTPGSFYKEWKTPIFKLSQTGGKLADAIRASMQHRETRLMNNDVLLSAIYVDPMYRIILKEEQVQRGKRALVDIAIRMHHFSRTNETCENTTSLLSENETSSTASLSGDEFDFEKHLDIQAKRQRHVKEIRDEPNPDAAFKASFEKALVEMEKIDRFSKLSVLQAIEHYPQNVQKVAYTVTALPPTQVSVERLFSALRLIRSDLRASMREDLIEAILFLRSNFLR